MSHPYNDHFHVLFCFFLVVLQHIFEKLARKIKKKLGLVSFESLVNEMWKIKFKKVKNILC